jgi:hypothetical protein
MSGMVIASIPEDGGFAVNILNAAAAWADEHEYR